MGQPNNLAWQHPKFQIYFDRNQLVSRTVVEDNHNKIKPPLWLNIYNFLYKNYPFMKVSFSETECRASTCPNQDGHAQTAGTGHHSLSLVILC